MERMVVGANDSGLTLLKFMLKTFPTMPQALAHKYIRLKCIRINEKRCQHPQYPLREGDILKFYINDEFFDSKKGSEEGFKRVKPDFGVVYEDRNIIIMNKPVGLLSQGSDNEKFNTLDNHLKSYLFDRGEYDPEQENSFAPALCNRLDKNTQGLVIGAKNAKALTIIDEKIKAREIKKYYMCLVHGIPEKKADRMVDWLVKDSDNNLVTVSHERMRDSKEIITSYEVVETFGKISLLKVNLETGRTHQIRAHMAFIGHPLVGDTKYGKASENRQYPFKYQALSSVGLVFDFKSDAGEMSYLNKRQFVCKPFFEQYLETLRERSEKQNAVH